MINNQRIYLNLIVGDAAMKYEPLWDLSNGITLCHKCHKKIHKMEKDNDK